MEMRVAQKLNITMVIQKCVIECNSSHDKHS